MKAIGYCRASTDKQQLSIPAQKSKLEAYAQLKGLMLDDTIEDDATTSRIPLADRTGGKRLCQMINGGQVQTILIVKLDRAFRNTVECLSMIDKWEKKHNVRLHIIDFGGNTVDTRTATGKMMLTFLAGMAEWERAIIGERTKAVLAHKKRNGERTGGDLPYGYDLGSDGRHLIPNQAEQKGVGLICRLYQKRMSYRAICRELERRQVLAKRGGKRWYPQTVKSILEMAQLTASAQFSGSQV